jgi:uncharacterized protein (TIGR00255 family)
MIKSMTGFASSTRETPHGSLVVTLRAVNHRHLDVQLRLPAVLAAFEPVLRAIVQQHISRGRIELVMTVQLRRALAVEVEVNAPLVTALGRALESAREAGLVSGSLTAGDLLRLPQALTIREAPAEMEAMVSDLGSAASAVLEEALVELDGMRRREGELLIGDLDARHATIADLARRLASAAEEGEARLRARLEQRVRDLGFEAAVEPALLTQEIVRTAARSDISEELVRLQAHLVHWRELVAGQEPCGRKLDFLLQEMNREVNTIGSKAEGSAIPELIVTAKAELEKMREQVQNVE